MSREALTSITPSPLAAVFLSAMLLLAGCAGPGETETSRPVAPRALEPGTKDAIFDAWANRVVGLERLWARVTVVVDTVDAEGEPVREQAEGHLQIVQPRRVALTLGKLGETYLFLGSNDERYWWFDTVDRDRRVAVTGRHAVVTPRKAAALGVPVHPLELIELLGIVAPTPEDRVAFRAEPGPAAGEIALVRDLPAGRLTWVVDDQRFEPVRVEIADDTGAVVLAAAHEAYGFARVRENLAARPRVPGRVIVEVPGIPARVRLALYEPENREIRPVAFDYERLLRAFRIDTVRDLDAESVGRASEHLGAAK